MNTPTYINNAHKALARNPGGLTLEELSGKLRVKALKVSQHIRELHDAGLIETTEDAGQPVYKLKAAPAAKSGRADIPPPLYDPASVAFPSSVVTNNPHTGTPRNPLDIESDPKGLLIVKDGEPLKAASKAERVLTPEAQDDRDDFEAQYGDNGDCSCHVSAPCGSCMHPGNPMQQENNDACWMAAGDSEGGETDAPAWATDPALQYLAPEDYEMPPADPVLLASANRELCHQLSHIATTCAEYLPDPSDITTVRAVEIMDMLINAQQGYIRVLEDRASVAASLFDHLKGSQLERDDLRDRLHQQIEQWQTDTGRLTADLRASMESRSQAINEADRLRAELATERQAREALQEQSGAVDVKDAAVGYLVRVPKRAPILRRKPESARDAALSAVRAGAKRADVLAVVPVGTARRGAEWQSTEAGDSIPGETK